ncbi:MAG TPA: phosphonate ABC transporter, permease protein PhnE [Beijerinckiaceae bacterium]|jgi:phosphonate transport system permease protein
MATSLHLTPTAATDGFLQAYSAATRAKRARSLAFAGIVLALALLSGWVAEVDLVTFVRKFGAFTSYFDRIFTLDTGQRVWTDPAEWFWGLGKWLRHLADTLLIAYLGTLLGAVGGFCLCFTAARNFAPSPWAAALAKRWLEFCRTVPEIVFALIFVIAFGLGPVPGVLAIAIHTMGALGKLFSEVVENVDMKPVEGVVATGGRWMDAVRFAALPQVLSNFASYALLRFEINVRGAAVMGFVGAGGIGQELIEAIRKFYYSDVSAILLLIVFTVMLIDLGTERLRHALIGREQTA